MTAVLVSRAPGFALADESEQQQRLAVWASVLLSAGHGAVRRIAWVQCSAPAQTDGLARWLHEQRDPTIPLRSNRIAGSYLELLEHSAQAVQENEVLLAIQVDQSRMRRDDRTSSSEPSSPPASRSPRDLSARGSIPTGP